MIFYYKLLTSPVNIMKVKQMRWRHCWTFRSCSLCGRKKAHSHCWILQSKSLASCHTEKVTPHQDHMKKINTYISCELWTHHKSQQTDSHESKVKFPPRHNQLRPPHLIITTSPQTFRLSHPEPKHHVLGRKEAKQGWWGSLNPKDDSNDPAIKQARAGSLTGESHSSSDPVRLSFLVADWGVRV